MKRIGCALAALCIAASAWNACAQSWPSRPVRVLVGFPAGGSTDIMARLVAPALTETFRQQFVIDNRPGANSNIANEMAARAAPDRGRRYRPQRS